MKKNKKEIIMISIMVLVLIIGITYAYFLAIAQSSELEITSKQLKIVYDDGTNVINAENIDPIYDDEIFTLASKKTFTIAKTEKSSNMFVKIDLIDLDLTDNFKDYSLKWGLYDDEDNMLQEGSFGNLDDKKSIPLINNILIDSTTPKEYHLYIYIEENDLDESRLMEGSITGKIEVTGKTKRTEYKDNSGANEPKLAEGMIPVIYDWHKDKWIKEENDERYYDYDSLMWANAVTVTSDKREDYMKAPSGTVVEMNDINSMWVWIPRYKYRIPESIGSTKNVELPPEIDVVFENGTDATGVTEKEYRDSFGDCSYNCTNESYYYTHPSFRDGTKEGNYSTEPYDIGGWDHELTGMWIGKFETGGTADYPIIKPNIISQSQILYLSFDTSLIFAGGTANNETGEIKFNINEDNPYGFNTKNIEVDTHMLKSIDWGMISLLSASKYGKMGNTNYEGKNKEIYSNNSTSRYTGRSYGYEILDRNFEASITKSASGYSSYSDHLCLNNETDNCSGTKIKYSGTGASTTGTIYGVYDMYNSNTQELVMGHCSETNSNLKIFKNGKYNDNYKNCAASDFSIVKDRTMIFGDATWETKGWYNDGQYIVYLPEPWATRGNYGIFSIDSNPMDNLPFHVSLIIE